MPTKTLKEKILREFDKKMDYFMNYVDYPAIYRNADPAPARYSAEQHKEELKELILSSFTQILQADIERLEGKKKYHKEFECNGANNGKGCYETFCEDQNCRNAPKEYNQALQEEIDFKKEQLKALSE